MATATPPPKLEIRSAARATSKYVRGILFGEQDVGKTMRVPTAPRPLWFNTEPTRAESLVTENIEAVYGPPPSEADIKEWLKEEKLKGAALEARIKAVLADPYEMTGLTWDVQEVPVYDYEALKQAVDFLKSPAAAKFETVFIDSASNANKMVLEYHQNKKTKSGNKADGRKAYGDAGDEVFKFFEDLIKIEKHLVLICHASEFQHNIGSTDEPIWQRELIPTFHGNKLKREAHHLFSNIFQVIKGRPGADGKMLYKDDQGNPIRTLKIRPDTPQGVERTLCPRLANYEEPNLTDIFAKLKGPA